MLLFTSNWISQLLVHDTPSQISVPYSSGHVLLLGHLWVRWADVLGLARLTHVSVVSWWLRRHVWPWSCSGLTLMFGCWLGVNQTGTTLTEVTRLSSTWSVILWGLAQAGSHGSGRIPRGSWDAQGLMWSRLRTAPHHFCHFQLSKAVLTEWETYKVKNVHPGMSLRLLMQSTCCTQNPNSMNLSLIHYLAWWETRIQVEQRAVDDVTSNKDTFHPSAQPFSVCWLVLRPARFEVSSSYQQELKTVASLFTFDRFFYLGVLTQSCAVLARAGFCPPIPTLAILWGGE